MLVLKRVTQEAFSVLDENGRVVVEVVMLPRDRVGITADPELKILRNELLPPADDERKAG